MALGMEVMTLKSTPRLYFLISYHHVFPMLGKSLRPPYITMSWCLDTGNILPLIDGKCKMG
jgi:hypothetical protein